MKKLFFAIAMMVMSFSFVANATGGDEILVRNLNAEEIEMIASDYEELTTIQVAAIVEIDGVKYLHIEGLSENGEAVDFLGPFSECGECRVLVQVPGGWKMVNGLKAPNGSCFECEPPMGPGEPVVAP